MSDEIISKILNDHLDKKLEDKFSNQLKEVNQRIDSVTSKKTDNLLNFTNFSLGILGFMALTLIINAFDMLRDIMEVKQGVVVSYGELLKEKSDLQDVVIKNNHKAFSEFMEIKNKVDQNGKAILLHQDQLVRIKNSPTRAPQSPKNTAAPSIKKPSSKSNGEKVEGNTQSQKEGAGEWKTETLKKLE